MSKKIGITFYKDEPDNGIHTFRDWGLKWLEPYEIPMPKPKTHPVDIPGADGSLDLTEVLDGYVRYQNREGIKLQFESAESDYREFEKKKSEISNYLHGQRMKMVLDTDDQYYYIGRFELDFEKTDRVTSTITVNATTDPYKYELYSNLGDWLWDTFNFETGDIRDQRDVVVDGEWLIRIPATRMPTVPTLTCQIETDDSLEVDFNGITYPLTAGTAQVPGIIFGNQEERLLFRGKGIVAINYTEGKL